MNSHNQEKVFQEERLQGIRRILEKDGRALVSELCKGFSTTTVTIRKDLDILEKEGFLGAESAA